MSGYEDVSDVERLSQDPAFHVGGATAGPAVLGIAREGTEREGMLNADWNLRCP
jgi:hypothetical protein